MVTPPYVGGPLRLVPFRAMMLTPGRIGDPISARAFARPYRAVAGRLQHWLQTGQITQDAEPALYLHEYTAGGITVRGLVGALDISRRATRAADRTILPHEGIHPIQADELADRMEQMQLNPAPILLVHRSPAAARDVVRRTMTHPPERSFHDRFGQQHRIWAIRDAEDLATLDVELAGQRALIADGHHRYAAYLRLQRRNSGGPADLGLAMLIDQDDTPLFLGAVHRVLAGVTLADLRDAAEATGMAYTPLTPSAAVEALGPETLSVSDGTSWASITLPHLVDRAAVEVLHDDIIAVLPRGPRSISHHHSVEETMATVRRRGGVAVLLPAASVDLVLHIVADDRLLPEKATSFQPKPTIGVLIRSLHDE